jgi:hypothetical protein
VPRLARPINAAGQQRAGFRFLTILPELPTSPFLDSFLFADQLAFWIMKPKKKS